MNRRIAVTAVLLFASLVLADLALGQDFSSEREALQLQLDRRVDMIDSWKSCARATLGLTLAVGFLGIMVSALQAHTNPKLATIIIGVVISSLTMINSTVFKVDHHTFNRAVSRAQHCIEDARLQLAREVRSEEEWTFLMAEFREQIRFIDRIESELQGEGPAYSDEQVAVLDRVAGTVIAFSSVFVGTAEAGEEPKQPSWITRVPRAKDSIYFVGVGASASLREASAASRQAAATEAGQYFGYLTEQAQAGSAEAVETAGLLPYLSKSVEVADTHYAYDPAQKLYRYYTLVKVRRQAIATDLEFYAIAQKKAIPESLALQIQQAAGPSPDFYAEHGHRLVRQHKYDEAIVCFEKALAMDGRHASARRSLEAAKTAAAEQRVN